MAFIWLREPQITSLIEMEHFWSHLQSCTNITLAFCSSKINVLSVTAMCFLGPVSTVFPERQHSFSIVPNKQNAYLGSCDHLERKRCTQHVFPGRLAFILKISKLFRMALGLSLLHCATGHLSPW